MKYCKKCDTYKLENKFGILKIAKDGLNYICKKCYREKINDWVNKNREKVNRNAARYRRTEKGKATKKRYYISPKGQEAYNRYNQQTDKKIARGAVNHAVESGKLPKTNTQKCTMNDGQCKGRIEYHHHQGYNKSNWFNVIPLCRKHHCISENISYHEF